MADTITEKAQGQRRAMDIYNAMVKEREDEIDAREKARLENPESVPEPEVMKRVRATRDSRGRATINLSKADRNCPRCHGRGRLKDQVIKDSKTGEDTAIPVVCRCVKRNGGVRKDLLDKIMLGETKKARWDARRKERRKLKRKAKLRKRN